MRVADKKLQTTEVGGLTIVALAIKFLDCGIKNLDANELNKTLGKGEKIGRVIRKTSTREHYY